jgi:hypothetical protein
MLLISTELGYPTIPMILPFARPPNKYMADTVCSIRNYTRSKPQGISLSAMLYNDQANTKHCPCSLTSVLSVRSLIHQSVDMTAMSAWRVTVTSWVRQLLNCYLAHMLSLT